MVSKFCRNCCTASCREAWFVASWRIRVPGTPDFEGLKGYCQSTIMLIKLTYHVYKVSFQISILHHMEHEGAAISKEITRAREESGCSKSVCSFVVHSSYSCDLGEIWANLVSILTSLLSASYSLKCFGCSFNFYLKQDFFFNFFSFKIWFSI